MNAAPPAVALVGEKELRVGMRLRPVPLRLTVCGLLLALSVSLSVPVRFPVAVGVKVTLIVQLAPAATEPPQVLVSEKSPLVVIVRGVRAPAPVLVSVSVCAGLEVEIVCPGKLR